jgi:hypothetical protein
MQHAQTDASQAVPGLGMVPTPSLTIYVCGAERAKNRDPSPANHACEESIVDRQRPGLAVDRGRSMVVIYVSDGFVKVMVTVARIPAQGLYDLTMVAEHSWVASLGQRPQLRYRYLAGNRVPGKTGEKIRAVNRWALSLMRELENYCCPVGKQASRL